MWLGYPLMKNDAPEHQFQKKPVGQHARKESLIFLLYHPPSGNAPSKFLLLHSEGQHFPNQLEDEQCSRHLKARLERDQKPAEPNAGRRRPGNIRAANAGARKYEVC
jgi:hypothetical protein